MANQIYQLSINYDAQNRFCSNITHWRFDDSGYASTLAAAQALCNAFASANLPDLIACLPTSTTVLSLKARRSSGGQGFEAVKLLSSGNVGTRTGDTAASGAGPVLLLYPPDPDGTHIGRTFLPGISISDINGGLIKDSIVSAFNANAEQIFEQLNLSGGGTPIATAVIPSTSVATARPVNLVRLSPRIGTQRRRQKPY